MNHYRSGEGWIYCLDLFEELEHTDGGEGNSKIWPAGKVELGHQPGSFGDVAGLLCAQTQLSVNNIWLAKFQKADVICLRGNVLLNLVATVTIIKIAATFIHRWRCLYHRAVFFLKHYAEVQSYKECRNV